MVDKDPHGDDRIEDLLSELQGIFGRLSRNEEDSSALPKQDPPAAPPAGDPSSTESKMNPEAPPVTEPAPSALPLEVVPPAAVSPEAAPPAPAVENLNDPSAFQTSSSIEWTSSASGPEESIVHVAIFYPDGREAEAKILAEKLETITPRFMKAAFQLSVGVFGTYDPKVHWKEGIFTQSHLDKIKAFFMLIERPLDDAKRRVLMAQLNLRGIYFQDVPLASIEKRAFYTDILLGLVFFFDAQKSSPPSSNPD